MDEMIAFGFVIASGYRTKVVNYLSNTTIGMKTIPTSIANGCAIRTNHISKVLTELKENGLVECINEEARRGRIYRLTSFGVEVAQLLVDY